MLPRTTPRPLPRYAPIPPEHLRRAIRRSRKTAAEIAAECWLPASAVLSILSGRDPSADVARLISEAV